MAKPHQERAILHTLLPAALLVLATALPGATAQWDDPRLVGRWYGHDYHRDQDRYYQRIAERTPDGRFILEFRRYEQCQLIEQQTISGTWWVNGDFWGTQADLVDGYATRLENTYILTSYDGTHTTYRHPSTGNEFTYERVDPEFEFPACDLMM
ncbi:hypothetical protein [Maricaulis sp.]|uniref:hypothetical protein n=1 Tax=Maricaulis sp. TaxID=1486257 RepID=UPI002620E5DD|nr:hypothetical protein [Maricaulis sp.]